MKNYGSKYQNWETDPKIVDAVLKVLNIEQFDFDACCSRQNIPAEIHMTEVGVFCQDNCFSSKNGLTFDWADGIGWMNPPYGDMLMKFCHKLKEEVLENPYISMVVLLPTRFENIFYTECVLEVADGIFFLHGKKYEFLKDGKKNKGYKNAPQPLFLAFYNFSDEQIKGIFEELPQLLPGKGISLSKERREN